MNKTNLIKKVKEKNKLQENQAEAIVNSLFSSIVEILKEDKYLMIRGFGSFEQTRTKRRKRFSNFAKDKISVSKAKNKIKFKMSESLSQDIN